MNLEGSNTEAFLRFHRFHERLNRSMKVQMIGLGVLSDEIDGGITADVLKHRLYQRPGWLWGGMPDWTKPRAEVEAAVRDIGQNGVVRAFSAFDLFLDEADGEFTSWNDFIGSGPSAVTDSADSTDTDRVDRFYGRLGGTHESISYLWPLYRYFRLARNCIAHREGIASQSLVEAYEAPDLVPALSRWSQKTGDTTPPEVVRVQEGKSIEFTHRQAIATSSILRLIGLDLTRIVISHLGDKGFVYLAARRAFLDATPLPETAMMESMVKAFNDTMSNRYRVRSYDQREGLGILRGLGLTKKCSMRFKKIKDAGMALAAQEPAMKPKKSR